jgi:hypothetical protein
MPQVTISATVETELTWEGHVPDDVPEDERREWIMENVDGSEFTDASMIGAYCSSWNLDHDVQLVEEEVA